MTYTTGSPLQDEGYTSEDIDEALQMISDLPVKRGMCRSGFTYSAILRYCMPSLGELRRNRSNYFGRLKLLSLVVNSAKAMDVFHYNQALRGRNGRRRY